MAAHNFTKVSLLQALSVTHDSDIIFLSETFLDLSILNDEERINNKSYNLLRADHPSNKKGGGVCMYYKEHLSIIKRGDLCTLKECLVMKIIVDQKSFFSRVCIDHRVRFKMSLEFEEFRNDLLSDVNDVSATLSVITSYFKVKSSRWWTLDKDNTEGQEIDSLMSACGYSQLINTPTYVNKEPSSCMVQFLQQVQI